MKNRTTKNSIRENLGEKMSGGGKSTT